MADNAMLKTLEEFNLKIQGIDSLIDCKGRMINQLRLDVVNPPNREEIEARMTTAIEELDELVKQRKVLVDNKHALATAHMNN
ncbi:hypothetical protein L195_g037338 [Trifolium pratense]|uniref:Uncharacterized protein n=1 Tax=Trifolium pratense TaxID=57577 RepID=A0A2K3LS04_TRIPR|nr:hypothetical protein L195_g037338 [Trifolium pratense]